MTTVSTTIPVSREQVFAVLADGWSYVSWVVGAAHIRAVDEGWPNEGTRIHHSIGAWPLLIEDITTVRAVDPPTMLELEARVYPFGSARVRLDLKEVQPDVTEVLMTEFGTRRLGRLIPQPVQALALVPRNRESLARLRALAIGKAES